MDGILTARVIEAAAGLLLEWHGEVGRGPR
jgi:hypothetical protein